MRSQPSTGIELLNAIPKLNLSVLPTPLRRLDNISSICGREIYCKRDDLTGFAFGGNKTRKLDFLIADAIAKRADTIVAIGANQSNFCRMAAAGGAVNGLAVHLVLGGQEPSEPTGNLLLDHLFGATIHHIDSSNWHDLEESGLRLQKELEDQGRNVYWLPIGGSTVIGALGYVWAFLEIMDDCERLGITADAIFHASSSSGTQAGLVVGQELTGWHGRIVGMGVAKNTEILTQEIFELARETGEFLDVTVQREHVIVDDTYKGPDYGARTAEAEAAIRMFARQEGILLDHVYTGKAAAGLIDYAKRGLFGEEEHVLFIHTGGNIELFE